MMFWRSSLIIRNWRIWTHLGWRDIRSRYASTILGPFLSTLALAGAVFGSSIVVGIIGDQPLFSNAYRLSVALTIWTLIASSLAEAPDVILSEKPLLLNTYFDEDILICRCIYRNFIIYLHNIVIVVLFWIVNPNQYGYMIPALVPLGALISAMLLVPVRIIARSALHLLDLRALVPALLQVYFFLSPILWVPKVGTSTYFFSRLNPVSWIMDVAINLTQNRFIAINQLGLVCAAAAASILGMTLISKSYKTKKNLL